MRALAVLLVAIGGPAAACPTADDLAGGIRAVHANGDVSVHARDGEGRIVLRGTFFGDAYVETTLDGLNPILLAFAGEGPTVTEYDDPPPPPGVDGAVTGRDLEAGAVYPVSLRHDWSDPEPWTAGGCTYDSVPGVRLRLEADGAVGERDLLRWLPDLGIVLVEGWDVENDPEGRVPVERIEAVR